MKSICICSVYIGNLPNTFDFWSNSVKNNPTINFILFTDQKIDEIKLPDNLKVINILHLRKLKRGYRLYLNFQYLLKHHINYVITSLRMVMLFMIILLDMIFGAMLIWI